MKRFIVFIVLSVVLIMGLGVNIQAEEVAAPEETEKLEWVNILDWDYVEMQYGSGNSYVDEGIIYMDLLENTPYQYRLMLDGLEPKFRMTGKIYIEDVIDTGLDDISGWNGIRIICGSEDFLNYNTVTMYRQHGVQVVNNSAVGYGPIVPYPEGLSFVPEREYTFELIKDEYHIIFKLNDTLMIDHTLTESQYYYNEDIYDNIGFIAINTALEVRDLKIEVEKNVLEATPVPTTQAPTTAPTEVPTEAPTTAPTEVPATEVPATEAPEDTDESSSYVWVWIIVAAAIVVVIVCVVVVVNKNKKG